MTYFDTLSWKLLFSLCAYHNYKEPSTKQEDLGSSASFHLSVLITVIRHPQNTVNTKWNWLLSCYFFVNYKITEEPFFPVWYLCICFWFFCLFHTEYNGCKTVFFPIDIYYWLLVGVFEVCLGEFWETNLGHSSHLQISSQSDYLWRILETDNFIFSFHLHSS